MRPGVLVALASLSLLAFGARPADATTPLPAQLVDTGGGTQLITVQAVGTTSTTGTLTWWDRRGGQWVQAGTAPARFGARGLVEGLSRVQGTNTTPTGLYDLPFGFGIKAAPSGTRVPYRPVHDNSYWCQDIRSASYNRWTEPLPADCRASQSEHLAAYGTQYANALVIGFNYAHPVRGRGAGIFLHVNGSGSTAGCVSVPADAMQRILKWADPAAKPHIAIGTQTGTTAIVRY
ncbi:L,D-transpeptidase [Streptomyces sp. NPDC086787]|uniref:L,D-transpeptidase family protein n=1 Tax=Streptomyces sp. NPDC086787 TaxID=3365759 RepID=UPI00381CEEFC